MPSLPSASALPPDAPARPRRLLGYLPLFFTISAIPAVIITAVLGKPQVFFQNLVVSMLIGGAALALMIGARPLLGKRSIWAARDWIGFALLALAVAPLAQVFGLYAGSLVLGLPMPPLRELLSLPRLGMVVFTLIAIVLMTMLVINRERLQRTREEHTAARLHAEIVERQALQAQLRLMQAQIEPHMLFNTLANLQGLIALDPERAGTMLDGLIQYLRATLDVSRAETTTLERECDAMRAYLGLMGVRMGERLAFQIHLPPELRQARLPTMLLQPLVENAIVHGLEPKVDGGAVMIQAAADGDRLVITVRDTGLGLDQMHGPRGAGVGVSTTRERLSALYGGRASLDLAPGAPCGTLATLTLPLETACTHAP